MAAKTKPPKNKKAAPTKKAKFDPTDKAKRPAWTVPGAWSFVYETGTSRGATLTREEREAPYVVTKALVATLKKGESATWRHNDRDVSLSRTHIDVVRLMVGEWEEAFTTTVAAGGGVTLFIGVDGAPLVIVHEEAGLYRRLIEINPA